MARERQYKTVLADPPWPYNDRKGPRSMPEGRDYDVTDGVGSQPRYGSMCMDELKSLPVNELTAENAHLYLWATNAFMVEAHELAQAWGFDQKTIVTWLKICKEEVRPSYRTGYYYNGMIAHKQRQ